MADMIVEYRVMPEDGEVEFQTLKSKTEDMVKAYADDVKILETKEDPVGFGLKAVRIKFQMDENHGSEELETKLSDLEEVGEVTVTLMDRL
jgi:translation elongation factor aEF-1 beta